MKLKIRDKKTGIIYTNDMSESNVILSINFCTSYTQVKVQHKENEKNLEKDLILPPLGTKPYWVDLIATQGDDEGEWVN